MASPSVTAASPPLSRTHIQDSKARTPPPPTLSLTRIKVFVHVVSRCTHSDSRPPHCHPTSWHFSPSRHLRTSTRKRVSLLPRHYHFIQASVHLPHIFTEKAHTAALAHHRVHYSMLTLSHSFATTRASTDAHNEDINAATMVCTTNTSRM
ncbi:hypothetical protein EDB85DRAFT_1986580 [Lactarius pseudohatsudake]|nr:hypothetical protein EDB85DRAFT_1986580 [Lactarius pseudohatsudake]